MCREELKDPFAIQGEELEGSLCFPKYERNWRTGLDDFERNWRHQGHVIERNWRS